MDGVLAEVTESYREAIVQTVEHFTGRRIERDLIQDYKNQGGWNNDWALSQKIAADLGVEVPYDTVVDYFNEIFIGERDGDGLDPARTVVSPSRACSNACASGSAWRSSPAACNTRPKSRSSGSRRIARSIRCCARRHVTQSKPAPEGLLDDPAHEAWTEALVRRRYGR